MNRDAERGRDEQMGGRLTKGVSTSGLGADLFLSNEVEPGLLVSKVLCGLERAPQFDR